MANERIAARQTENETVKNKEKDTRKIVKLGDSADLHDTLTIGPGMKVTTSGLDTIERREKNREKKSKVRKHRAEVEKRVTEKARLIIGIGPVLSRINKPLLRNCRRL